MADEAKSPSPRRMLMHFSLYGFLKNQQYYKPFMFLYLLVAFGGVSLAEARAGLVMGYGEILQYLFEVPSGAVADIYGRRRCMMFSFLSYIASFAIFGFAGRMWHFLLAMTFFALAQAFRTGTHKAMIFSYLAHEGRTDEKTQYYGTTRSWSKMGSAVAAIIGPVLLFVTAAFRETGGLDVYRWVFLGCIVPYVLGLINFLFYPKYLDGAGGETPSIGKLFTHLFVVLRDAFKVSALRRLVVESMGYEGLYKAAEYYLQPIVRYTAILVAASIPFLAGFRDAQATAILIGVVYCAMGLLESFGSRRSDTIRRKLGGEEQGARFLWWVNLSIFSAIAIGLLIDWRVSGPGSHVGLVIAIVGFMALALLQNLWRPMHIGRFDTHSDAKAGATILSIESQAKSLSAAVFYPLLGLAVGAFASWGNIRCEDGREPPVRFLPVAAAGVLFAALVLIVFRRPARTVAGDADGEDV